MNSVLFLAASCIIFFVNWLIDDLSRLIANLFYTTLFHHKYDMVVEKQAINKTRKIHLTIIQFWIVFNWYASLNIFASVEVEYV